MSHEFSAWYWDGAIFKGFVRHCYTCEGIQVEQHPCDIPCEGSNEN